MSLTGREIDLIESLADRIEKANNEYEDGKYDYFSALQAIGEIRRDIMHGETCPCSKCAKWTPKSCIENGCDRHRKISKEEIERFSNSMEKDKNEFYFCGSCNSGHNEWYANELLFDMENEIAITPCCHTEATESLVSYDTIEGYDQRAEDEASYRYSVFGR